ncbi:hypothetical protein [Acrocarpospora sp. B8E8]|uniref:hypothetical protein n=1 Tax=Acrocarpospora sp. B8E8 TaxID=3153572 RepID=UPI00325C7B02
MRRQLRPFYTPEQLEQVYAHPYDHSRWREHRARIALTVALAQSMVDEYGLASAADLSCGDGAILDRLDVAEKVYGDFVPGRAHAGPIERAVTEIARVGLFILSETIEHVEDPDALLAAIRAKADALVLTTPNAEDNDGNPEHYWSWDDAEMRRMLATAGWAPTLYLAFDPHVAPGYTFQFWGCR